MTTSPAVRRATLGAITLLAAVSYAWRAGDVPLEPYYAAAVRTMASDWRAFAFGAFDPALTITLDKLPGAFWVQALSVRAFGWNPWSLVLPQILAGAATVPLLYRAVRRPAGPGAGLLAALVLAASPAVVVLDRGNISDTVMILLLVAAADAVSGAIAGTTTAGRRGRLLLAGLWVGLAFQAKMLEAWLVLPALAVPYLLAGPGRTGRRTVDLLLGGVVTAVVSLAWVTAVALVPAGSRPWVDGSLGDSPFEQVFVYNGLGRVGQPGPLQVLAEQGLPFGIPTDPGPARLLLGPLGLTAGWLLPLALVIAVAGVIAVRARPRTDPLRAAYLMWGAWLVLFAVAFSAVEAVNPYYTAALAPPAGALIGAGVTHAWVHRRSVRLRVLAAVLTAGTAAYAALLSSVTAPRWLVPVVAVVAVVAVLLLAVARRTGGRTVAAGFAVAVAAVLLAPGVASATVVTRDEGALDVPFEPARLAARIDAVFVGTPLAAARAVPGLERLRYGAPALLAVQSSAAASVFAETSGQEVLPIGGFTGTGPVPSLDELRGDVAAGRFHLVLVLPSRDPRTLWISTHCHLFGHSVPPFRDYLCVPADATP